MQKQFNFNRVSIKLTIDWNIKKSKRNNWHVPLLYIAWGESFMFLILGIAFGIGIKFR